MSDTDKTVIDHQTLGAVDLKEPAASPEQVSERSPVSIEGLVVGEQYYRFPGTNVTVACLHLRNGSVVLGVDGVWPVDCTFNEAVGREVARNNAQEQIWALENYLHRQRWLEARKGVMPA